jgi:hypothetical protein
MVHGKASQNSLINQSMVGGEECMPWFIEQIPPSSTPWGNEQANTTFDGILLLQVISVPWP